MLPAGVGGIPTQRSAYLCRASTGGCPQQRKWWDLTLSHALMSMHCLKTWGPSQPETHSPWHRQEQTVPQSWSDACPPRIHLPSDPESYRNTEVNTQVFPDTENGALVSTWDKLPAYPWPKRKNWPVGAAHPLIPALERQKKRQRKYDFCESGVDLIYIIKFQDSQSWDPV